MASNGTRWSITGKTRYLLTRKLAVGGMGAVYEAEQYGAEGFSKTIAIKTILPKYSRVPMFVEMFIEEAKLVADLVHQNIVQIYQLGWWDDTYFIAMEYIDGVNLEQFIERHKELGRMVPVDLASFIISRVCRGLEYAHTKRDRNGHLLGIVHRDVCPKNIMITREGEIKLTDFGVAKAKRFYMRDVEGEFVVGKDAYMSPEQAAFQPTDGRSDLFSLGIVYFELLTGVNRFRSGETRTDARPLKRRFSYNPLKYRKDIPHEVSQILARSLRSNVEDRYASASEMAMALEMYMYSKGYGPTIVKLAKYLGEIFPERQAVPLPSSTVGDTEMMSEPTMVIPGRS